MFDLSLFKTATLVRTDRVNGKHFTTETKLNEHFRVNRLRV